jgi:hypothetical protein
MIEQLTRGFKRWGKFVSHRGVRGVRHPKVKSVREMAITKYHILRWSTPRDGQRRHILKIGTH